MNALTREDLERAITDPKYPAEDLTRIFRNRGYRDAVLSLAIRSNNWDGLVAAARRSMAERGAQTGEVPYGEFTILAMASWRSNGELFPSAEDLKELMLNGSDEEIKMLVKLIEAQNEGVTFDHWANTMRRFTVERCISFALQEIEQGRG